MKVVIPLVELSKALESEEFKKGVFEVHALCSERKIGVTQTLAKHTLYFGNYVGPSLKQRATFEEALQLLKEVRNVGVC